MFDPLTTIARVERTFIEATVLFLVLDQIFLRKWRKAHKGSVGNGDYAQQEYEDRSSQGALGAAASGKVQQGQAVTGFMPLADLSSSKPSNSSISHT